MEYWHPSQHLMSNNKIKRINNERVLSQTGIYLPRITVGWVRLTWDTDAECGWSEHLKGVDDYIVDLKQKK